MVFNVTFNNTSVLLVEETSHLSFELFLHSYSKIAFVFIGYSDLIGWFSKILWQFDVNNISTVIDLIF
jgi:hypothetical protein